MQKFTPCLLFDNKAEEAAKFYVSVFPNSKIDAVTYYTGSSASATGRPKGSVMTVSFTLQSEKFLALNGPHFKFSEAISFMVNCKNQAEIDKYWEKLSAGGEKGPCGWLKDKYGMSWQIVPDDIEQMLKSKDPKKTERVMLAVMQMKKLDIKQLHEAAAEAG